MTRHRKEFFLEAKTRKAVECMNLKSRSQLILVTFILVSEVGLTLKRACYLPSIQRLKKAVYQHFLAEFLVCF
jgi:hypothetical protein